MLEVHTPKQQFPFKENNTLSTENYMFYRDNRYTKNTINNRHDLKMSKYNNAGYGYQIFYKSHNVGSIWFLNQINSKTTYIRISRYESTQHGHFIAVLSELNDLFSANGYSIIIKTSIPYAQKILDKNFSRKFSKKSNSKRGKNDRSTKNVSIDGYTYYLDDKVDGYDKWHDEGMAIDA